MSLKIEVKDSYSEDLKRYINDYNSGVELQDIMEVNLAIDGILMLIFHTDQNLRNTASIALIEIANKQPGFLKKGIQVLLHRYKGSDVEKSEFASIILGKITGTLAKQLITDPAILNKIIEEHNERIAKEKFEEEERHKFLEAVKSKEISLLGLTGEFLHIGQFYNKQVVDDSIAAHKVLEDLITATIKHYDKDEEAEDFEMGCTLFSIITNPENREPFVKDVLAKLVKDFMLSKKKQMEAYKEFIINTIKSYHDLLPEKYKMEYLSIYNKRQEDKKKESLEKIKQLQQAQRLSATIIVTWEKEIKDIASIYNESLKSQDEKEIDRAIDALKSAVVSKNPYIKKSAIELYSQILEKNYSIVEEFTQKLVKNYKDKETSVILEENIELLDKKELLQKGIKIFLEQDKAQREAKEKEEKEKLKQEFDRIEKLKVEFSAAWDKRLVGVIEAVNNALINEKIKEAEKIILGNIKKYCYAEDKYIAKQACEFLNNVAKKYPDTIYKIMKEILELFYSEHEDRGIAVDLLGLFNENPNRGKLFIDLDTDFLAKLKEDVEKREAEIKQSQLLDKWDAIKLDVTTIVIDSEYEKKLEKVCRAYNEGIKAKDKEKVIQNVQIIVDWFLAEKNEEKLNHIIEVLGKIAKQNIELIAPAIDMFLKMVDSEDVDKKFRAIKGLGEVTVQRPGWAYMGIDKLVQLASTDENENARMNALIQLSRVGRTNPTMLMEHKMPIIEALRDPNRQVRRLAAFTIGAMAEAIPLEAQEAIPALREALHDEYFLTRQFADKALKLIRAAMRK